MKDSHAKIINASFKNAANGLKILEILFEQPIITIKQACNLINVSYPTAKSIMGEFCQNGILSADDAMKKNKKYKYQEYIELLETGTNL
ncbi:MAG: winged helix-turn-helix transcriptional regulator [Acidaminococcales bacterium]|nr:winged helix-turn-helix transcriptional regulator [Acidaminococcales bacterium]